MISTYDVKTILKNKKDDDSFPFYEMGGKIYSKENNDEVCDFNFYVDFLRKKLHCYFETVYYNHGSLTLILRCKECGSIIFTGDDERYDPNLCCPVCSGYNHNNYWTAEDIKNDPKKQKQIEFYEEWTKSEIEAEKRRKARGGLYDWQIFKKDCYGKKKSLHLELTKMCGYMLEVRDTFTPLLNFEVSKTYVNGHMTNDIETIRHYIMTKPHTRPLTWTNREKPDWWNSKN